MDISQKYDDVMDAIKKDGSDGKLDPYIRSHFDLFNKGEFGKTEADILKNINNAISSWETGWKVTRMQDELMARLFEGYVYDGKTFSTKLGKLFAQASQWMRKIYNRMRGNGVALGDNIIRAFDGLYEGGAQETEQSNQGQREAAQGGTMMQAGEGHESVVNLDYDTQQEMMDRYLSDKGKYRNVDGVFVHKDRYVRGRKDIIDKEINAAKGLVSLGLQVYLLPESLFLMQGNAIASFNGNIPDGVADNVWLELKTVSGGFSGLQTRMREGLKQGDLLYIETTNEFDENRIDKVLGLQISTSRENGNAFDNKVILVRNGSADNLLCYKINRGNVEKLSNIPLSSRSPKASSTIKNIINQIIVNKQGKARNGTETQSGEVRMSIGAFNKLSYEGKTAYLESMPKTDYVPVPFSRENWDREFSNPYLDSPIGVVKIGENQYEKDKTKGDFRNRYFAMIRPTIETPLLVLEEDGGAKLFLKSFNSEGKGIWYYGVVVNKQDDKTGGSTMVAISTHRSNRKQVERKLKNLTPVYLFDQENLARPKTGTSGGQTTVSNPDTSTTAGKVKSDHG